MARTSFTVTELNAHIKQLLDADALLGNVCVTGELSNYKVYPSGHHYCWYVYDWFNRSHAQWNPGIV